MAELNIKNAPKGIDIVFDPYCNDCNLCTLTVRQREGMHIIECAYRRQCNHINKYVEKKYEKETN